MEYGRKESPHQTCVPQTDSKSTSGPTFFIQKPIDNPQTCIVQRQIDGTTAKMLVVLPDGGQRLITFDIPNEECTVQDLLEQANIPFGPDTSLSLVTDPTFKINFVVETGTSTFPVSDEDSEQSDSNLSLDEPDPSFGGFARFFNPLEKSGNDSLTQQTVPKYLDGKQVFRKHRKMERMNVKCFQCSGEMELSNDCKNVPAMMVLEVIKSKMLLLTNYYNENVIDYRRPEKMHRDTSTPYGRPVWNLSSTDEEFSTETSGGREYDAHNMADGSIQAAQTSLICRTVRIGSYKYIPQDGVIISQSGVRLRVPLREDITKFVLLEVKLKDILKVLVHFGKAMPVLFFYTTKSAGGMIRELLGMRDPKGPYYDPAGKDHTLKRITLLPEKISEEAKIILKTLFPSDQLLAELSSKEANDILARALPKDSQQLRSMMKMS